MVTFATSVKRRCNFLKASLPFVAAINLGHLGASGFQFRVGPNNIFVQQDFMAGDSSEPETPSLRSAFTTNHHRQRANWFE